MNQEKISKKRRLKSYRPSLFANVPATLDLIVKFGGTIGTVYWLNRLVLRLDPSMMAMGIGVASLFVAMRAEQVARAKRTIEITEKVPCNVISDDTIETTLGLVKRLDDGKWYALPNCGLLKEIVLGPFDRHESAVLGLLASVRETEQ